MNHVCQFIQELHGNAAFKVEVIIDEDIWMLVQSSFAIEQNVRSGEAEYIGEPISSSAIKISFCPFCGRKLQLLS